MTDASPIQLDVTDPTVVDRRIGFTTTCQVLLPPGIPPAMKLPPRERASSVVRECCMRPTTHVVLVPFTDGTYHWQGRCSEHATGD